MLMILKQSEREWKGLPPHLPKNLYTGIECLFGVYPATKKTEIFVGVK